MTDRYTDSKGRRVLIAGMAYPHLKSAHDKAVRTEAELRDIALSEGTAHSDPEREAEIEAMRVELEKRDADYAAQKEAEGNGGEA